MKLTLSHTANKPAPSRLRTCLLLLLLTTLLVACADNNMNIEFLFYEAFDEKNKAPHQSITFTLQDTNGTAKYVQWDTKGITWTRNSQNLQDFPTIDCSKAPTFATGFTPDPNGLPQLTPYIQATGKKQDGNTVLVGRMPLHVACKWRSLTFFLGRPWRVNPWPILKDSDIQPKQLSLIGQQITRLSDGRLLISGGASQFALGGPKHIQVDGITGHLYLYNPATNELILLSRKEADFALTPARAFHTAIWSDNRVVFSGGIGDNANVNNTVQELFITTPDMTNLSEEEKKRCAKGVGKIIDIPRGDNFERLCLAKAKETRSGAFFRRIHVQGKDAQSKGISFGIPGLTVESITTLALSNNDQPQTLFHQATYLANEQTILVTGGFTFDPSPGQERFRATNFLYSISVQPGDADNAPTLASISPITAPLQSPRAGHTATPIQNGKALLLIGGITGSLSNTTEGTNLLNINASAEVLVKNGNKGWLSKPVTITNTIDKESGKTDFVVRRAFHTAVRISSTSNADRILLYGGVRNLSPADDTNPHPYHYVLVEITQKDDNYTMNVLQIGHTGHEQFGLVASHFLETGQVALFGGAKITQEKGILSFKTDAEKTPPIQLYVPGNETHEFFGPISPATLGYGKEDEYNPAPNNPPAPVDPPPPPPPTPSTDTTLVCTHKTKPDTPFCAESKLIQHTGNVQSISVLAAPNDTSNTVYQIGTFSGTPTFCRDQNGTAIQRRSTGSDDIFIIRYKEQNGKPYCDRVFTYGWKGQDSVAEAAISADGKRIYLIGTVRGIDKSWTHATTLDNPHQFFFRNLNPKTQEDCTKSGATCSMAVVTTLDFSTTPDGTLRHRPLDVNTKDTNLPDDKIHGEGQNIAIHSSGAIFAHLRTNDYEMLLYFDEKSPLKALTVIGNKRNTRPKDETGAISKISGIIHDVAQVSGDKETDTRICLAASISVYPEKGTASDTPKAAIICYQRVRDETAENPTLKWTTSLQIQDRPNKVDAETNSAFIRIQLAKPTPNGDIWMLALGRFDINPTLRVLLGGTEEEQKFSPSPVITMTSPKMGKARHYFMLSARLTPGQGMTYKRNANEQAVQLDKFLVDNHKQEPGYPLTADSKIKLGPLQTNHDHSKIFFSGVLKGRWSFGSELRGKDEKQTQFFTYFDAKKAERAGWSDNDISADFASIPAPSITSNKHHNAIFSILLPDDLNTTDFMCKVEGKTADTKHISAVFFSKTCTFGCNQFVCQ